METRQKTTTIADLSDQELARVGGGCPRGYVEGGEFDQFFVLPNRGSYLVVEYMWSGDWASGGWANW
jgi:hypothetical protein